MNRCEQTAQRTDGTELTCELDDGHETAEHRARGIGPMVVTWTEDHDPVEQDAARYWLPDPVPESQWVTTQGDDVVEELPPHQFDLIPPYGA